MGDADFLAKGSYNVECDRCDKKIKSYDAKHEWTGAVVCPQCYDPRHSQDFTRGKRDRQSVPNPRPDSTIFVGD